MNQWMIFAVGFLAQLLFSARLISQWFLSEKSKKVETPVLFWKLSLLASILLFTYGYLREDLAIMLGQFLIYGVYWRNLRIQNEWKNRSFIFKLLVVVFPVLIIAYIAIFGRLDWKDLVKGENIALWMIALGIVGQLVYTCRFFYQWYYAEKYHESILPTGFWILSLMGSSLLLTYGIFRKDPVLMSAHFFGGIIYMRDLYLSRKTEVEVKP
ncbi:lipid-A-disaccharide synthase N-terminal domain-containing protein [Zunongwangia sp. F363]|uniref:Lipid-A-disaccharide synthase N-terminal domain-containing protein n=1 Tax=Autumnicola tepida TaxID=3075595 RepID=A0ABU3C4L5_9FLAO|nr:lipid-A-disaccharide synthase N-terminal domain-containing protein [Zunongwangia sp. F363]MDT0641282.1 lipid-A-disaccharide synthase N-terminal domain-containing protein [Zunongwangia sp. F363]